MIREFILLHPFRTLLAWLLVFAIAAVLYIVATIRHRRRATSGRSWWLFPEPTDWTAEDVRWLAVCGIDPDRTASRTETAR